MKVFIETASKTVSAMILVSLAISIMAQVGPDTGLAFLGDSFSCKINPDKPTVFLWDSLCALRCFFSGYDYGYCQIRRDGNKFCVCSEQLPPLENQKCGEAGVDGSFLERQKQECSDFCSLTDFSTSQCVALEIGNTKSKCVCGEVPLENRVCSVLYNATQPFTEVQLTACRNFCRNGTTSNISSRCLAFTDVLTKCVCGAVPAPVTDGICEPMGLNLYNAYYTQQCDFRCLIKSFTDSGVLPNGTCTQFDDGSHGCLCNRIQTSP